MPLYTLQGRAHAYRKTFDNLTMLALRLLPGTTIAESGSFLHTGSGLAQGFELLVQGRTALNTIWAGYTLGRVEYTYPTLEAATFPASFDQLSEFKITDTMRFGRSWSIGGVWVIGSGRPDTPALGVGQVWLPSGDLVYQVTFGPKNSDRLPPYHRLDLSAQRDIRLGAIDLVLRGTVFNVYDQQNVAYHQYETVIGSATVNDVTLMRRAVNVSLRVAF